MMGKKSGDTDEFDRAWGDTQKLTKAAQWYDKTGDTGAARIARLEAGLTMDTAVTEARAGRGRGKS